MLPQFWSSDPVLATLMFTASKSGRPGFAASRWAAIQSRPQTYHDRRPSPDALRIRTDQSRTPGATPTTPMSLSIAPTVPATWVPCQWLSPQAVGSGFVQL